MHVESQQVENMNKFCFVVLYFIAKVIALYSIMGNLFLLEFIQD